MEKRFYQKTWFAILMFFIFFPVGLFLLWKHSLCSKQTKIYISIAFFAIVAISSLISPYPNNNYPATTNDATKETFATKAKDSKESNHFSFTFFTMTDEEKQVALEEKLTEIKKSADEISQVEALYNVCMLQLANPSANHADLKNKLDALNHSAYKIGSKFDDIKIPKGINTDKETNFKEMKSAYSDSCDTLSFLASESSDMIKSGNFSKYKVDELSNYKAAYYNQFKKATSIYKELNNEQ